MPGRGFASVARPSGAWPSTICWQTWTTSTSCTSTQRATTELLKLFDFDRLAPEIVRFEHAGLSQGEWVGAVRLLARCGYRTVREEYDTTAYRRPQAPFPIGGGAQSRKAAPPFEPVCDSVMTPSVSRACSRRKTNRRRRPAIQSAAEIAHRAGSRQIVGAARGTTYVRASAPRTDRRLGTRDKVPTEREDDAVRLGIDASTSFRAPRLGIQNSSASVLMTQSAP